MARAPAEALPSRPARAWQSLSARLLWLTVLIVLLTEVLVFVPDLSRERLSWLNARITDAHIAALSVAASPAGLVPLTTRNELLRLSATERIALREPGGMLKVLAGDAERPAAVTVDLRTESPLIALRRAFGTLLASRDRLTEVIADSPFRPGTEVDVVLHERALSVALRRFAANFAWVALLVAASTGAIVYLALLVLLVRPMRRLISSIAAFRADPEHAEPLDPGTVSLLPGDEMAVAGHELAAMEQELRTALWRNARLASLGTAVAKVSHDLRGILSPALLSAESLQMHADASVRRTGDTLVLTVDRATDLVRKTLDFAREGPPALSLTPVGVAALVAEAAETARPRNGPFRADNRVPRRLEAMADRNQLFRVLVNLMRNAAEAGARTVRVQATAQPDGMLLIEMTDDGPGLPARVRDNLFRPFASGARRGGTGLGLAIVRELMLAHGGDISLAQTGASGTSFLLRLPAAAADLEGAAEVGPAVGDDL